MPRKNLSIQMQSPFQSPSGKPKVEPEWRQKLRERNTKRSLEEIRPKTNHSDEMFPVMKSEMKFLDDEDDLAAESYFAVSSGKNHEEESQSNVEEDTQRSEEDTQPQVRRVSGYNFDELLG